MRQYKVFMDVVINTANDDLLTLSLTNGAKNKETIIEALRSGNVTLTPGTYPIDPEIYIDSRTLDLNGATLVSTELRHEGSTFYLCGDSPCIKNGRLSGRYFEANLPDAPGSQGDSYEGDGIPFEKESAVRLVEGGYSNAKIENVKFDHWCGYAVNTGGALEMAGYGTSGGTPGSITTAYEHWTNDGAKKLCSVRHQYPNPTTASVTSPMINQKTKYVTARHAIGHNYYISSDLVKYTFLDASAATIREAYGIPGEPIPVPEGTKNVTTETKVAGMIGTVPYGLFEYVDNCKLEISGCEFVCNQRLGIANLLGESTVKDCVSRSNGYPREDHTGIIVDNNTSGFMDIEDIQTPILHISNCSSENEDLGVASRAYQLDVKDSPNLVTRIYDGWSASFGSTEKYVYNSASAMMHCAVDGGIMDDYIVLDDANKIGTASNRMQLGNLPLLPCNGARYEYCSFTVDSTHVLRHGKRMDSNPYGSSELGTIPTFKNCNIVLNADWIKSNGVVAAKFINCFFVTQGHYLVEQITNANPAGYLYFENCSFMPASARHEIWKTTNSAANIDVIFDDLG